MGKKIKRLNNGILFVSHKLNNVHSLTVSVNFKVGSLFENEDNNGITHLLEHLMFRRLDDLDQAQLYYRMQCLGCEIIGKTYNDFLSFEITVVPENFIPAFELMLRYFNEFKWNDTEFESEKKVVLKQIENYSQSYSQWIDENYLSGTQYELPIMGTENSVQKLSIESVIAWKKKYLCPHNSCVTVTGKFAEEEYEYAAKKLDEITTVGQAFEIPKCLPMGFNRRNFYNRYTLIECDSELSDIVLFVDISSDIDYETVRLLSSILGEGCGSRLGFELRERYALTDDIDTDLMLFFGFSRLSISFTVNKTNFYESIKLLLATIKEFKQAIRKDEYDSSICFFTKNQLMDYNYPCEMNRNYVFSDFVFECEISEPSERKKKYEGIGLEDLQSCAEQVFTSENISFLIETSLDAEKIKRYIEETLENYI